jgi:cation transport regulator ChaC
MYLRRTLTAFTKENPDGVSCLVYITNEESDLYQGSFKKQEIADLLLDNEDFDEYFYGSSIALDAINGQDKYLVAIKGVYWPMKKEKLKEAGKKPNK